MMERYNILRFISVLFLFSVLLIPQYVSADDDSSQCPIPPAIGQCPSATPDFYFNIGEGTKTCGVRINCTTPKLFNCNTGVCYTPTQYECPSGNANWALPDVNLQATNCCTDGQTPIWNDSESGWECSDMTSLWTESSGNVYRGSGNVGIGTNSPENKLHVVGDAVVIGTIIANNGLGIGVLDPSPDKLYVNGSATIAGTAVFNDTININKIGTSALKIGGNEAIWFGGTAPNQYFSWGYGGHHNFFADPVGIGTVDPGAKLHIKDTTSFIKLEKEGSTGTENIIKPNSEYNHEVDFDSKGGWNFVLDTDKANSTKKDDFQIKDGDGSVILSAEADSGNVGIGTDDPVGHFHVKAYNGNIPTAYFENDDFSRVLIKSSSGDSEIYLINDMGSLRLGMVGNDGRFRIRDTAYGAPDILTIKNEKVGIGNSDPQTALDVTGNTKISGTLNINKTGASALQVAGKEALWYGGNSGAEYFSWGFGGTKNYFADPVGIGTNDPQATLDVVGDTKISGYISFNDLRPRGGKCGDGQVLQYQTGEFEGWYCRPKSDIWGEGVGVVYTKAGTGVNVGLGTSTPYYDFQLYGTAAKNTGTAWINQSDIRLKDIKSDYEKGLNEIMKLRPITFRWKKDNPLSLSSNEDLIGFIAQEADDIFPEAVSEGENGYLDFDIHPINVAMVNAIKDLKAEKDAEIAELKAEIEKLRDKIE